MFSYFINTRDSYIRTIVALATLASLLTMAISFTALEGIVNPKAKQEAGQTALNMIEKSRICSIEANQYLYQIPYEPSGDCVSPELSARIVNDVRTFLGFVESLFILIFSILAAWRLSLLNVSVVYQTALIGLSIVFPPNLLILLILTAIHKEPRPTNSTPVQIS